MPTPTQWMLVTHTLCQGVIPSEWDASADPQMPVLYPSRGHALLASLDWLNTRNDTLRGDREFFVAQLDESLTGAERFSAIRSICEDHPYDEESEDWPIEVMSTSAGIVALDGSGMVWTPEHLHQLRS